MTQPQEPANDQGQGIEVGVSTAAGNAWLRGGRSAKDFMIIATFALSLLTSALLYFHRDDSNRLVDAINASTVALREMTCVLRLPLDRRDRDLNDCKIHSRL